MNDNDTLVYFSKNLVNALPKEELKSLEGNTTNVAYRLFKWGYTEGVKKSAKDIEKAKKRLKNEFIDLMGCYVEELEGLKLTLLALEEAPYHISDSQLYMIGKVLERIAEEINNYIFKMKEPTPTTDQVQE